MKLEKIFQTLPYKGYLIEENNSYSENIIGVTLDIESSQFITLKIMEMLFGKSSEIVLFSESIWENGGFVECKSIDFVNSEVVIKEFSIIDFIEFASKNFINLFEDGSIFKSKDSLFGFTFDGIIIFSEDINKVETIKEFLSQFFSNSYYSSYGNLFFIEEYDSNKLSHFTKSPLIYNYPTEDISFLKNELSTFAKYNFNLTNNYIHHHKDSLRFESKSLDNILEFFSNYEDIRSIYHGITAQRLKANAFVLEASAYDDDTNLTLQSFIREISNIKLEVKNNLEEIILDRSIFFNKLFIFGIYDSGIDILFLDEYTEKYFKSYMGY